MKLIKTSLVVLIATVGFFSNAQETKSTEIKAIKTETQVKTLKLDNLPETKANQRTDELDTKVQLTDAQKTEVKALFLKIENRKSALTNLSEDEKSKALSDLEVMEKNKLNEILTPAQKKTVSTPQSAKKAASM